MKITAIVRACICVISFGAAAPATASAEKAEKELTNSVGMKLIRIEAGEFVMGQGDAPPKTKEEWLAREYDESPAHEVKISSAFHMGAAEVTNAQYEQFDPAHKSFRGRDGASKGDDEPVTHVSWQQAVDFCAWLSRKEGKPYRLPTEAEWEYACRAGTRTVFYTGDDAPTPAQANLGVAADRKPLKTVKVGSYPPNPWGLHDMMGNVGEWCHDWHGEYQPGRQVDPVGPADGIARVVRGWSYNPAQHAAGTSRFARSANRSAHLPDDANRCTGFRVVQAAMPATPPSPLPPPPLHQRDVAQTPAPKDGPDPASPYLVRYTAEKKLADVPKDAWGPVYSAWNHFAAVVVCPNGDVLAAWYTTVSESGRECAQAASRLRAGSDRWEPASSFLAVADCNAHAPVLLSDGKRLYHFFTQSLAGWDDSSDYMRTSDDSGATWSKPRIILSRSHPQNMSQPCSAFVAKDGTIVLAVDGDRGHRDERVLLSRDRGATWAVGQGDLRKAAGRYVIHPAVVETRGGAYLAFLRGPDPMPAFVSRDRGESWEPRPTPFPGISVGAKAAALKLQSGALLLVSFESEKKPVAGGASRVFAALSFDDGKTWPHVRSVDGVGGYMSLAQAPNGVIYHFGSRMQAVAYNEAWLRKGLPFPAKEAGATWTRQEKAVLGPTRAVAFVYAPTVGRFMALGYQHPPGTAKRNPTTYDEVAFDPAEGQWENWYPSGKDWGPKFGAAAAPGWKGERGGFKDVEGNVRPNWPAWYWLLGAGRNYCWDTAGKQFIFHIDGKTFSYDPAARRWTDLAAANGPQSIARSQLLWGSICYDEANKRVVLFGGGNAQTPRGDVGTWTYTPATNVWAQLKLDVQPPPRANAALVYDPANKKVVLFGGDQLNQLVADTWTFDGTKWEERKPAVGPSPRAGHAMLWLPKAQKVLLLGGYTYTSSTAYYGDLSRGLPLEAWTYDVRADRWDLVQRIEPAAKGTPPAGPTSPGKYFFQAAADADDRIAALDNNRELWMWNPGTFAPDAEGIAAHGVKPGTIVRRTGSYDPAWYREDVPPADPAKVDAELAAIPTNRWVRRSPAKQPMHNSDWGSAIYCVDTDQIIRFSGGHAAYSGTAPHVYDIRTDRWSIPFAPEIPVEFTYGNDGVPGEWSFGGNPWMTGHTYKSLGYDPNLKGLVFGPHKNSYLFDPRAGTWSRFESANPYQCSFYTVTLIPTPKGLVAWANGAGGPFWRLNAADRTWTALPVNGKPFGPICDNAGMAYDSKRDRMLAFACKGKDDTTMFAYDLTTGQATPIEAAGADRVQQAFRANAAKGHFEFRESVYLPDLDLVMNGATGLFYDSAKNAWFKAALPSDAPDVTRHPSYNLGVMYDTRRKLVWAVDTNFNLHVLRLNQASLKLDPL